MAADMIDISKHSETELHDVMHTLRHLGENPDADLIALCARHVANHAAYNTDGGYLEPDEDPLWEAYCQTHDAIGRAQPQTIEGALAKARAAKVEALSRDGTEVSENGPAARWAWQLMNDMLRLSGRAGA